MIERFLRVQEQKEVLKERIKLLERLLGSSNQCKEDLILVIKDMNNALNHKEEELTHVSDRLNRLYTLKGNGGWD
jgi:hypothetical protein